MILYRVVHVGWREYPWEVGTTETIHKWYYHSTKEAAIEHCAELHYNPLEFMVNQHKYILIVTTDDYILTGLIRMDLFSDLIGGSLTFKPENLNNSVQKPAESA